MDLIYILSYMSQPRSILQNMAYAKIRKCKNYDMTIIHSYSIIKIDLEKIKLDSYVIA